MSASILKMCNIKTLNSLVLLMILIYVCDKESANAEISFHTSDSREKDYKTNNLLPSKNTDHDDYSKDQEAIKTSESYPPVDISKYSFSKNRMKMVKRNNKIKNNNRIDEGNNDALKYIMEIKKNHIDKEHESIQKMDNYNGMRISGDGKGFTLLAKDEINSIQLSKPESPLMAGSLPETIIGNGNFGKGPFNGPKATSPSVKSTGHQNFKAQAQQGVTSSLISNIIKQKRMRNNNINQKNKEENLKTNEEMKSINVIKGMKSGLSLFDTLSPLDKFPDNAVEQKEKIVRIKRQNRRNEGGLGGRGRGLPQYGNQRPPNRTPMEVDSHLQLINGLYQGVLVKISPRISEDDCRDVIQGLQVSLREFSSSLYVSTDGRASLGKVKVILPQKWSSRSCHTPSLDTSTEVSSHDPQIHVNPPHPLFGDAPWTQQSAGCFKQGDFISLGVNFLKEANSSSELSIRSGKVLAGEWAKFRWGVFSEVGHSGDPLYPPWYLDNGEWTPTLCSDISFHSLPCHPDLAHRCPWPPKELANASSSLLSTPNLPHVNMFCTKRNHNSRAPTKQNNLCKGASAKEVIMASHDFSGGRNPPGIAPLRPPDIIFVRPNPLKFVLLVEDSGVMNQQRRWEFVRKAVRRTVVYDLPDDAYVSVVVFNTQPTEVAPLSKLESVSDLRERVGSSLPRNPSNEHESKSCIKCAIDDAVRGIRTADLSEKGANIVLLTTGELSRDDQLEEISKRIWEHEMKLLLVLFPFTENPGRRSPDYALTPLAKGSGGSVFTVMDEGVGYGSKVSMLVALMEALTAAVAAGGADTPVLVHLKTYAGGVAPLSTGTFSLDDSLAPDAKFAVYYYDLNHVGNTIHLTAPSGSTFASVSMQEEDSDVNMIFVNLHDAERGTWTYKVENRADSHQGLHIQVTSRSNPSNDVKVRVWTSQKMAITSEFNSKPPPIIIYGEIKVGGSAVMNAGVMAILQRLGTNNTGGSYPPVMVPLLDLGTGDPDITKGDGIYSRYAPPLEGPAKYALILSVDARNAVIGQGNVHEHDLRHHRHAYVKENFKTKTSKVSVSSPFTHGGGSSSSFSYGLASSISSSFYSSYYESPNSRGRGSSWGTPGGTMEPSGCCGSALKYENTRQAPPFTRQVTGPTIDSRSKFDPRDNQIPPARISDLIAWINSSSGLVVLEWTAVGTNRDWGRAHHYEGAATHSLEQALHHCSGKVLKGLPDPSPASNRETVLLPLDVDEKKTLYVCLRAVDKSGNKGPSSNAAAVWLPRPPSMDRVTVRARFGGIGSSAFGEKAMVISGIVGGVILVAVLVGAYCYCVPVAFRKRFKARRRDNVNGIKNDDKDGLAGGGSSSESNLINGGSLIIKSQSRKSVLTAAAGAVAGGDSGAEANGTSSTRRESGHHSRNHSGSNNDAMSEERRMSREPFRLMNNDGPNNVITSDTGTAADLIADPLNGDKKTLSMSIPDVTRVDHQRTNLSSSPNKELEPRAVPSPQFYTLGRRPNRPSNNPFFDSGFQQKHMYNSSSRGSQKALNDISFQMMGGTSGMGNGTNMQGGSNLVGVPKGEINPFITPGFRPTTPNMHQRGPSMHESETSLYGSQEGDSVTDVLLCDDRTSSPPPPAPTGPQDPVAFKVNRHSMVFP